MLITEITGKSKRLNEIKEIFEEAFPKEEREFLFESFVAASEAFGKHKILAAYEDDFPIGFAITIDRTEYVAWAFFAINRLCRSKGKGSEFLKALLDYYRGRTLLFVIEKPVKEALNYEQRLRREKFYLDNKMIETEYTIDYKGELYTYFTSRPDSRAKEYIDNDNAANEEYQRVMLEIEGRVKSGQIRVGDR